MCGRFTQTLTPQKMQEFFDLFRVDDFPPRYNIAPTQLTPIIRVDSDGHRVGELLRWGLVPPWAKSAAEGSKMINCRSESASTKPAFRRAFQDQRCLIPATGFFEWQADGTNRTQPWYLTLKSGNPAAFAGLWETWNSPEGDHLETFTILTTTADDFMGEVHDRMPITLKRESWPVWLDPSIHETKILESVLKPSVEAWQRVPVSAFVNNIRNDSPTCIQQVKPQRKLFD